MGTTRSDRIKKKRMLQINLRKKYSPEKAEDTKKGGDGRGGNWGATAKFK